MPEKVQIVLEGELYGDRVILDGKVSEDCIRDHFRVAVQYPDGSTKELPLLIHAENLILK